MKLSKKNEIIGGLVSKLNDCMENNSYMCIHMNYDGITMRHSIIPEDIHISENEIHIESGSFQLSIDNEIDEIECDDESFCITSRDGNSDIYIDFI